ncbi:hypothetical protein LXA43DRAFT_876219 [Ganoderma leucocontextum]|nr:hypothetical protein LXA43DRAFT_876219 [Ganoderma leucocontextum]
MVNHWLRDLLDDTQCVTFTSQSAHLGKPHTPSDTLTLTAHMVEAMDDSIIISPTLPASQSSALAVERFQAAYGWETSWSKSLLAMHYVPNPPQTVSMPSVDPCNPDAPTPVFHHVQVSSSHCDFLRIQINDPHAQYLKIRQLIIDFQFPNLYTRLPLTALHRIVSQCLISRIRSYLAYQPIARAHADELDHLLATRIHDYLRFPFRFNSSLLYLPLSSFGFTFPSVARLNDAAALSGLIRDLNHHIPSFRTLARITLADWTCMLNHCHFPLEGAVARSFSRSQRTLPFAWIVAADVLRSLHLAVRDTDQSYLFTGDVALRHLSHILPPPPASPSSHVITNLERAGFTHLSHLASWQPDEAHPSLPSFTFRLVPHAHLPDALRPYAASRDWPLVHKWLSTLTLPDLARASAGLPPQDPPIDLDHLNRWSLALPRPLRRDLLESFIIGAASLRPSSPLAHPNFRHILASDASAIDTTNPSLHLTPRHVTFAAASPASSVALAIARIDPSASSLHGEVFGLVSAALLRLYCLTTLPPLRPTVYTDHLNSVPFVDTHLRPGLSLPSHAPPSSRALPLYHWLFDILNPNRTVDTLTSTSHSSPLLSVPLPTFTLPDFALHGPSVGYVSPSSLPSVLSALSHCALSSDPTFRPNITLFRSLYDPHPPPTHPYTRSSSAYSAVVQLYARSAQLDSAQTRHARLPVRDVSPSCHFGCDAIESAHHLLVTCPHFSPFREAASTSVLRDTSGLLDAAKTPPPLKDVILHTAAALFHDDPSVWPQSTSHYYLGTMPFVRGLSGADSSAARRLASRLFQAWHTTSIHLAGRIWGAYKRRLFGCTPSPPSLPPLPPHLSYLTR